MGVETSAVEIQIRVTDANSAAAVGQVERSLTQMGNAGGSAGTKIAAGMDHANGHFQTAFDSVRLLRTELGVRMPRAMESMIARNEILMRGITALGGLLATVGTGMIFVSLGEELGNIYTKWFSAASAVQAYQKEVQKTQQEDFGNTRSIEDTRDRIEQANDAVRRFQQEASQARKDQSRLGGNLVLNPMYWVEKYHEAAATKDQMQWQGQLDKLRPKADEQAHESNIQQIELNHALDGELRGRAKITAELQKQRELNAENRRYAQQQDSEHSYSIDPKTGRVSYSAVDPNSGKAEMQRKDAIAQKQADAETFNLERDQGIQIRHLREQATEAALQGAALFRAQEAAAIADLRDKDMDSVAARAAVHAKFHADELKRLREEETQTRKMERDASAAGLTGLAKTQAEGQNRVSDIQDDLALDPAQRARRVVAAQAQANAEMVAQEEQFTDRVDALVDSSNQHQISGFARIAADRRKQLDELQKEFDSQYGRIDITAPGGLEAYAQGASNLDRGRAAINSSADQQTTDLARKNADETAQIESQARARFMSVEKQQTAAIEQQYEERLRKYQEELNQQEISQDDFNRRVAAAAEERNAELVQQAQEARQKIAGEMRGLFGPHPLQALQEMGSKYASEAGAAVFQRVTNHFGGHTFSPESAIDRLAGVPGTRGGRAASASVGNTGAISIAQAQIFVSNASIMGAGGGGSMPAGFGPHTFAGSGSTSLMGGPNAMPMGFGGRTPSGVFSGGGASATYSPARASGGFLGATGPAGVAGFASGFSGSIGGAGSSTISASAPGIASPHISPSSGGLGSAFNLASTGLGDAKQLAGMFKGNGASAIGSGGLQTTTPDRTSLLNADGTTTSAANPSGGMTVSNTLGMAGAGLGLFSAFKSGGAGGMMGGAMSGAELGMKLGGMAGPEGAVIGAAIGAVGGLALGFFGGSQQARLYNERQVIPRIGNDTTAFNNGSMDYSSAYSDLESLEMEARNTTNKMGFAGQRYYQSTIKGELSRALSNLTREQRAGRSQFGVNAAQFDVGTDSVLHTGMAVIHENERIIPSDQNERITRAIEGQTTMPAQSGNSWQGDLHVHAIDAKSSVQWLMQNKHNVRAAMNASYGENSGGADAS